MDRRESLKLMLLAAVAPRGLYADTWDSAYPEPLFSSSWHTWPDVHWAGPEYWGNRLQDWVIRDGNVVCRSKGRNRMLSCLTHRAGGPSYSTSVMLDPSSLAGSEIADAYAGFWIGVKGPFADYRSAAVRGSGIGAGIRGNGTAFVGATESETSIELDSPLQLRLSSDGSSLSLSVFRPGTAEPLAVVRQAVSGSDATGNLALVSHFAPGDEGAVSVGAGDGASFSAWSIEGPDISSHPDAAFGPIMFAQYTVHRGTLKLTAQLAPVDDISDLRPSLEFQNESGVWESAQEVDIDTLSRTARFRIEEWDASRAVNYRVKLRIPLKEGPGDYTYEGTIAAEPAPGETVRTAVFSCNADHGFPDTEVVENVGKQAADLALFLGDQYYEGTGGFRIQTDSLEMAALDMLHRWYMFGWSYRDIFRDLPSACIPDDHDVYHGNVWGEGGKNAPTDEGWGRQAQDQGGYKMPADWVNAVQRTQTSHLPDPYDPAPVEQGIDVYYSRWDYGGISFAIIEDRKFKSAPKNVLPEEAQVENGWIFNPDFDILQYRNLEGADLLGVRQMEFLKDWASDWSGSSQMKVVLSQTNFAAVHTIPTDAMSGAVIPSLPMPEPGEYVLGDKLSVDMDSNGWPATERDRVLRILQSCSAFHIAGDQHLATVVRHGIDEFGDAGYSFTGPALNNIWPRRWWPPTELCERPLADGPQYGGDFRDGFGNRITVHAAANPRNTGLEPARIRDRVTGYGIVEFDTATGAITIECWPRQADPELSSAQQYEDWPISIHRDDGDGRKPVGYLPEVVVSGITRPVIQIRDGRGRLVYSRRLFGDRFRPPVFHEGVYVVRIGDPDANRWQDRVSGIAQSEDARIEFDFN